MVGQFWVYNGAGFAAGTSCRTLISGGSRAFRNSTRCGTTFKNRKRKRILSKSRPVLKGSVSAARRAKFRKPGCMVRRHGVYVGHIEPELFQSVVEAVANTFRPLMFPRKFVSSKTFSYAALLVGFVTIATIMTARYTQVANLGYKVNQLRAQLNVLERENQRLQLEASSLQSLERLNEVARSQLAMRDPKAIYVVEIDESQNRLVATRQIVTAEADQLASSLSGG